MTDDIFVLKNAGVISMFCFDLIQQGSLDYSSKYLFFDYLNYKKEY